eukprot:766991-Hanusia_phi.AAC.22
MASNQITRAVVHEESQQTSATSLDSPALSLEAPEISAGLYQRLIRYQPAGGQMRRKAGPRTWRLRGEAGGNDRAEKRKSREEKEDSREGGEVGEEGEVVRGEGLDRGGGGGEGTIG